MDKSVVGREIAKMDIQYKKASIEALGFLTEIRIKVLRAANRLAEDVDLSNVKRLIS